MRRVCLRMKTLDEFDCASWNAARTFAALKCLVSPGTRRNQCERPELGQHQNAALSIAELSRSAWLNLVREVDSLSSDQLLPTCSVPATVRSSAASDVPT
jgi:hypothetical protein